MGIVGIVVKPLRVYMGVGFGFGVRVFMNSGRAVRASVYSFMYEIWDLTVAQTKQNRIGCLGLCIPLFILRRSVNRNPEL